VHGIPTLGLRFFTSTVRDRTRARLLRRHCDFRREAGSRRARRDFWRRQQVRDFTYVATRSPPSVRSAAARIGASVFDVCTGKGRRCGPSRKQGRFIPDRARRISPAGALREVRVSIGDRRRAAEQLGFRAATARPTVWQLHLSASASRGTQTSSRRLKPVTGRVCRKPSPSSGLVRWRDIELVAARRRYPAYSGRARGTKKRRARVWCGAILLG